MTLCSLIGLGWVGGCVVYLTFRLRVPLRAFWVVAFLLLLGIGLRSSLIGGFALAVVLIGFGGGCF